jgi:hypothetical protein
MKGRTRTTWRSRSGTTEKSDIKRKDKDVIESAGAEGQRSVGGVADAELRKWTRLTTLTARMTTTLLTEEEMVTVTEMEAAVMARATKEQEDRQGGRHRRNSSRDRRDANPNQRAKTDRNHARGRSASPHQAGRHSFEETAMEMGLAFLQLLTTMTDQSKKTMEYGKEKKSVIRRSCYLI